MHVIQIGDVGPARVLSELQVLLLSVVTNIRKKVLRSADANCILNVCIFILVIYKTKAKKKKKESKEERLRAPEYITLTTSGEQVLVGLLTFIGLH